MIGCYMTKLVSAAAVAAPLLLCSKTAPAASFNVGSFSKSTAAAPVTQAVAHGLAETPKAVILWTNGKTNESFSGHYYYAFGVTDGTTSYSAATAKVEECTSRQARGKRRYGCYSLGLITRPCVVTD